MQRIVKEELRSTSAPPSMNRTGTSDEVISLEELQNETYRCHPDYHAYYFSFRPIDPRLPKPLFSWNLPKPQVKLQLPKRKKEDDEIGFRLEDKEEDA